VLPRGKRGKPALGRFSGLSAHAGNHANLKGSTMLRKLKAFLRGVYEFRRECTWADPARDEMPSSVMAYTELDEAYDHGREWAHRLTFRRFDE
jgi:hypothetical protein